MNLYYLKWTTDAPMLLYNCFRFDLLSYQPSSENHNDSQLVTTGKQSETASLRNHQKRSQEPPWVTQTNKQHCNDFLGHIMILLSQVNNLSRRRPCQNSTLSRDAVFETCSMWIDSFVWWCRADQACLAQVIQNMTLTSACTGKLVSVITFALSRAM